MIIGIGIDIIEVKRLAEGIERHADRFTKRLFTDLEIGYCSTKANPAMHYAGRFAAKEAAFKAMGRGWGGGVSWKDVEIYNESSGAPFLNFYGKALELVREKNMVRAHVSISHIADHATAVVVIEA